MERFASLDSLDSRRWPGSSARRPVEPVEPVEEAVSVAFMIFSSGGSDKVKRWLLSDSHRLPAAPALLLWFFFAKRLGTDSLSPPLLLTSDLCFKSGF